VLLSPRTPLFQLVAAGVMVALLAACTSEVVAEEDPAQALREAVEVLSEYQGIDLRFALDADPDPSDLPATDLGGPLGPMLLGSTLEVRSSATQAAHARIAVGDDPAAMDVAERTFDGLAAIGLDHLGETLAGGDWIRVSARPGPQEGDEDRIAAGLADAMERLLERANAVTHEGVDAGVDRLRLLATDQDVQTFVDEAVEVVSFTAPGGGSDDPTDRTDRPTGNEVTVAIEVSDGHLTSVALDASNVVDAGDVPPLMLRMDVEELDEPVGFPPDAMAFSLRGLMRDLAVAVEAGTSPQDPPTASQPTAPDEPVGSDEPGEPDEPAEPDAPREPAEEPFREGGVLDEAFGEENPFEGDEEFDCVTEEDLVLLGEALGPDAVEEVEELLEQGLLVRC
jgi:hypothetical protein